MFTLPDGIEFHASKSSLHIHVEGRGGGGRGGGTKFNEETHYGTSNPFLVKQISYFRLRLHGCF